MTRKKAAAAVLLLALSSCNAHSPNITKPELPARNEQESPTKNVGESVENGERIENSAMATVFAAPWFRVDFVRPVVVLPHVLEVPEKSTNASVLINGEWQVVASSREQMVVWKLADERSVLMDYGFQDRQTTEGHRHRYLYRQGEERPVQLPCAGQMAVSNDGTRIVCLAITGGTVALRILSATDGRIVSDERAVMAGVVPAKLSEHWMLAGFDQPGDPVVCLRSGKGRCLLVKSANGALVRLAEASLAKANEPWPRYYVDEPVTVSPNLVLLPARKHLTAPVDPKQSRDE
ncbi:MAG: hypothetical protein V2A73_03910 [Pseudomonadota bacterium]